MSKNDGKFSSIFDIYRSLLLRMQRVSLSEFENEICWNAIFRSYQSTSMYRELKLRSAILASGQLKLLPKEQLYNNFGGIWNLSSDQGNLGTFLVTNVRLIWYADINDTFNISLPYIQIDNVSPRSALSHYIPEMQFFIFLSADKDTRLQVRTGAGGANAGNRRRLYAGISRRSDNTTC